MYILQQVTLKTIDKSTEQRSAKQWAIQANLGDKVLDEFHSKIPQMAHEVCLYSPVFLVIQLVWDISYYMWLYDCLRMSLHP